MRPYETTSGLFRALRARPRAQGGRPCPPKRSDVRLLVAEHSDSVRRVAVGILTELGFGHIDEVGDGSLVLERLHGKPYDMLVVDLALPHIDGLSLLRAVRGTPSLADLPVIVLASHVTRELLGDCVEAGADGFVVKPFAQGHLEDSVTCALRDRPTPSP